MLNIIIFILYDQKTMNTIILSHKKSGVFFIDILKKALHILINRITQSL